MSGPMPIEVMEVECIKEDPDWESVVSKHELLEDLYADHKVKEELVLGPELLQRVEQPLEHNIIEVTVKIEEKDPYDEEIVKCNKKEDIGVRTPSFNNDNLKCTGIEIETHYLTQKDLFKIQNCYVRIERMALHKEKYTCKTCEKTYSLRSSLTKHMRTHAVKKTIAKKEISNATNKKTSACVKKTNTKKCAVEKPHECGFCGKQFKLKALLINHERIHSGEKPFSCNICNRRFTESSNLKRHERTHSGEKPFSCEVCKKQFSLKSNLMDHIRVHTKERPYSCILCSQTFPDLSGLNRHKVIHLDYKKFTCDICKKKFARKHYITEHMRTHNKKKM